MFPQLFLAALLQSATAEAAVTPSSAGIWKPYVNVRYGFQVCYPEGALKPQGEADNSDGQKFVASDGAELRVFGSNNVFGRSLATEAFEEARHYIGKRGRVTYRIIKPDWAVISGNDGGSTIFYTKMFQRNDQFITLQLRYSRAVEGRYKAIVEHLSSCFRLTDGHV